MYLSIASEILLMMNDRQREVIWPAAAGTHVLVVDKNFEGWHQ